MDLRPLGESLDALGIKANLEPDDIIEHAIVILKVLRADGNGSVLVTASPHTDWYHRYAMIGIANGGAALDMGESLSLGDDD